MKEVKHHAETICPLRKKKINYQIVFHLPTLFVFFTQSVSFHWSQSGVHYLSVVGLGLPCAHICVPINNRDNHDVSKVWNTKVVGIKCIDEQLRNMTKLDLYLVLGFNKRSYEVKNLHEFCYLFFYNQWSSLQEFLTKW